MDKTNIKKTIIKQIPNFVTILRIIGAINLIFLPTYSKLFYSVYIFCGITDILDGFLARKLKASSDFGAKLDSASDIVFYSVMVYKIFPALMKMFSVYMWISISLCVAIRIASYIVAIVKYHKFAALHTYLNKAASFVVYFTPFFTITSVFIPFCVIIFILWGVSSVEELMIHISSSEYNPDRKTILK